MLLQVKACKWVKRQGVLKPCCLTVVQPCVTGLQFHRQEMYAFLTVQYVYQHPAAVASHYL